MKSFKVRRANILVQSSTRGVSRWDQEVFDDMMRWEKVSEMEISEVRQRLHSSLKTERLERKKPRVTTVKVVSPCFYISACEPAERRRSDGGVTADRR